ncbi:hypothetical protein ACQP1P_20955 [Dactylosporangium sp. CA-052675]|uniref:hypothetical protein n=1 Tax=Dactylosporangium sp. CA-052675 TaxID=3239927 RepID=UPI003D934A37
MADRRASQAIPLAERAVDGLTRTAGPEAIETLRARSILAWAYLFDSRFSDAITTGEAALRSMTRAHGLAAGEVQWLERNVDEAREARRNGEQDRSPRSSGRGWR